MRRLNEARKLYQSEKDRLNQLNEELSLIEEKKSKRFLYDDDVSIVKNTETKTFHSDCVQKKHKIKDIIDVNFKYFLVYSVKISK